LLYAGCGKYNLENRINLANNITKNNNFIKEDFHTSFFDIRTYHKFDTKKYILKIYIEGDGFAWIDRYTMSSNPTPINPVALKLALNDNNSNIAYIARPCQYILNKLCNKEYWGNKRFSSEVINSINQTITKLKKESNAKSIKLIGFSGGGAIVTLVASLRNDIVHITTIAGNLNHKLLHKYHKIPPMDKSLNPIDIALKISNIPQIHYIGEKDTVIPKIIAKSFKDASNNNKIKIIIIPNATHTKGWSAIKHF
jgi:hypothetical protein